MEPVKTGIAALAALLAGSALVSLSMAGESSGPEGSATPQDLQQRLRESGLRIRYRQGDPRPNDAAILGGVARGPGGGRVGFEFVFARDGEPSTDQLGTVGFPVEFRSTSPEILPVLRGTLGDIAYANFFLGKESGGASDMRVARKLDDALFGAFPPDDAEAHPILEYPPE